MALWQFTTLVTLIGALLIYLMVLTNRIGATNALLKRIEEALVPQRSTENVRAMKSEAVTSASESQAEKAVVSTAGAHDIVLAAAPVRTARVPTVQTAPVSTAVRPLVPVSPPIAAGRPTAEPATGSEGHELADVSDGPAGDRRVSFLTVRDLKVIASSSRPGSDSTLGMSPLFREAMERKRAEARSLAEGGQTHEAQISDVEEGIVASAVSDEIRVATVVSQDEAMEASRELHGLPVSVQELATATHEIRDFLESAKVAASENAESFLCRKPDGSAVPARPEDAPIETSAASEDSTAEAIAANEYASVEAAIAATEERPTMAQVIAQPNAHPIAEDLLERRRKRNAELILSAQRRRRRTRGF